MILFSRANTSTEFSLDTCIMNFTKKQLVENARILNFNIPSNLLKHAFVEQYCAQLVNNSMQWLTRLTRYEVTIISRLIKAGANGCVEIPAPLLDLNLQRAGIVFAVESGTNEIRLLKICDTLRVAIGNKADQLLANSEQQSQWLVEEYAIGLSNLYGVMSVMQMARHLGELLPEFHEYQIWKHIQNSAYIWHQGMCGNYFCSAIVEHADAVVEDIEQESPDDDDIKIFSKKEILDASGFLIPELMPERFSLLHSLLTQEFNVPSPLAAYKVALVWQLIQFKYPATYIIEGELAMVLNKEIMSETKINRFLKALCDFTNEIPIWTLRGYSNDEAWLSNDWSQVTAAPSMTPAVRDARKNIGRNEPCPCGSGKKYKQCCGK